MSLRKTGIAGAFIVAAVAVLPGSAFAAGSLVAEYRFNDNLDSSVAGAPSLSNAGAGNGFASESVGPCGERVLTFPKGNGLKLATSGLIPQDRYTVALRFRFAEIDDYKRILSFEGSNDTDNGFYTLDGRLGLYNAGFVASEATASVSAGAYAHVALTRSATDQVVGYSNGVERFTYLDASDVSLLDNPPLGFFLDDTVVPGEVSAGAVASIRLYDDALTPAEVTADLNRGCDPPATAKKCKKKGKKKKKKKSAAAAKKKKKKKKCKKGKKKK
jgi:hypothetical protein